MYNLVYFIFKPFQFAGEVELPESEIEDFIDNYTKVSNVDIDADFIYTPLSLETYLKIHPELNEFYRSFLENRSRTSYED